MKGIWRAPGRANLMGEHTDYNLGLVLPFALGQTMTAAAESSDGMLSLRSAQAAETLEVPVASLEPGSVTGWAAYPAGVAWAMRTAGYPVPGATISFDSDVPVGSGLSSSAALEAATALALRDLAELSIGRAELASLCQRAENEFVGAPTGIMDQSASLRCEAGHALLLDCADLSVTQVPFDPASGGAAALVIDTRAHHAHTGGGYGARRKECEEAARQLGVPYLGSLTTVGVVSSLTDPVLRRRARHVISDDLRVRLVVEALTSGANKSDIYRDIGALLTEAHISLRDDFEISWPEANATVDAALSAGGFGARMIGGGFGGSVLALLPVDRVPAVRSAIQSVFSSAGWPEPGFYDAVPSAGASRIS
jgi:galactokinase